MSSYTYEGRKNMGTRSIIAIPNGDGYKGRYAHWDGYPEWMGRNLWEIVKRDGLEQARRVLVEDNFYWSNMDASQADAPLKDFMDDGRFRIVPGYGVSGTHHQASPDEWVTHHDSTWCEWVYVLGVDGLLIGSIVYEGGGDPDNVNWCGMFPWNGAEPVWSEVGYVKA
jgi:hypothetical protein